MSGRDWWNDNFEDGDTVAVTVVGRWVKVVQEWRDGKPWRWYEDFTDEDGVSVFSSGRMLSDAPVDIYKVGADPVVIDADPSRVELT